MDKQKQIEEMAKDVSKNCDGTVGGRTCYSCRLGGISNRCIPFEYAKRFYKAGYRKIPENAVVLTREEYEELAIGYKRWEKLAIEDMLMQSRKETAEKFAERLKAELNEWLIDNEDNDGKIDFGIAEIELIGVISLEGDVISESLIDEIAKEIMES